MSIICVVKAHDSIVMSADNRCTHTAKDGSKTYDNDFSKLYFLESVGVGISSCGDAIINSRPLKKYFEDFENAELCADKDNIATVAGKLYNNLNKLNVDDSYHFVCGFFKGEQMVFLVSKERVQLINDSYSFKGHEIYGFGLEAMYSKSDSYTLGKALEIAQTIVALTIKGSQVEEEGDPGYNSCGGNVTSLIIEKDSHRWTQLPLA